LCKGAHSTIDPCTLLLLFNTLGSRTVRVASLTLLPLLPLKVSKGLPHACLHVALLTGCGGSSAIAAVAQVPSTHELVKPKHASPAAGSHLSQCARKAVCPACCCCCTWLVPLCCAPLASLLLLLLLQEACKAPVIGTILQRHLIPLEWVRLKLWRESLKCPASPHSTTTTTTCTTAHRTRHIGRSWASAPCRGCCCCCQRPSSTTKASIGPCRRCCCSWCIPASSAAGCIAGGGCPVRSLTHPEVAHDSVQR
jgi:hypothetical protein